MLFVIVFQLSFVQPYLLSVCSLCELMFGHIFFFIMGTLESIRSVVDKCLNVLKGP